MTIFQLEFYLLEEKHSKILESHLQPLWLYSIHMDSLQGIALCMNDQLEWSLSSLTDISKQLFDSESIRGLIQVHSSFLKIINCKLKIQYLLSLLGATKQCPKIWYICLLFLRQLQEVLTSWDSMQSPSLQLCDH